MRQMRELELTVPELLAAAQLEQQRQAKLDVGRIETVSKVGGRATLRTMELRDSDVAADIGQLR
jgi:hypothetical protein